jgi:hypothetical protein
VSNDEKSFLDHLNAKNLQIGDVVTLKKKDLFDGSVVIFTKSKKEIFLTQQVAERIWVD